MIKFRVKQEPPSIEDQELIDLVKAHEFLYNTKNPDYRNLPLRACIWADIAKLLNIDDRRFNFLEINNDDDLSIKNFNLKLKNQKCKQKIIF